MPPTFTCEFEAVLYRVPGNGGWVFAPVPPEHAPATALGWGRTPVRATVNGHSWQTSVWRETSGRTLLAVPARVRGELDHDDSVRVALEYGIEYR
jgi:hypothetical protein